MCAAGDDGDDARRAQHLGKIDPPNRAARHRRTADGDMHGADRLRHIVDILGRALHVLAPLSCGSGLYTWRKGASKTASRGGIGHHPVIGNTRDARADARNFGNRLDD